MTENWPVAELDPVRGGFRLPGARLAGPLLKVLGDRAMRTFSEHPALRD